MLSFTYNVLNYLFIKLLLWYTKYTYSGNKFLPRFLDCYKIPARIAEKKYCQMAYQLVIATVGPVTC